MVAFTMYYVYKVSGKWNGIELVLMGEWSFDSSTSKEDVILILILLTVMLSSSAFDSWLTSKT